MKYRKLIFELSKKGRTGVDVPKSSVPESEISIPEKYLRKTDAQLPEVSEQEAVRHYIALSNENYHIDKDIYPLGSCTMKYNPKINEETARFPGFSKIHPLQYSETVQGALRLMYELKGMLLEISGFDDLSLQPVAGAHGELTALMMIRKYHEDKGNNNRKYVITPDSSHGTNPASIHLAGYKAVEIKSNEKGKIDIEKLKEKLSDETAAIMITNPNTLGLFETEIEEIIELCHEKDALVYLDGANLNALMGIAKPGEMGFDVMHFNFHKTLSTPHGGGGPGGGCVAVNDKLAPFLPYPIISQKEEGDFYLSFDLPKSIGKVHSFYGNFGVMVRAFTYLKMLGKKGVKRAAKSALMNANYLKEILKEFYHLPYDYKCMHEFVLSGDWQKDKYGVSTLDIAKRLLDYGVHAPTVYFPLIVREAIMVEPTETETIENLDHFAKIMIKISKEAEENPEIVKTAPQSTFVKRLNEALAAKNLDVKYELSKKEEQD